MIERREAHDDHREVVSRVEAQRLLNEIPRRLFWVIVPAEPTAHNVDSVLTGHHVPDPVTTYYEEFVILRQESSPELGLRNQRRGKAPRELHVPVTQSSSDR